MNKLLSLLLILIMGILLVVGGFMAGLFLQKQRLAPRLGKASDLINLTQSPVISSITASGKVTGISGRTIILQEGEETLDIPISKEARIVSLTFSETEAGVMLPERKEIELTDIKEGEDANITLDISESAELKGVSVIVLPSLEESVGPVTPE